MTLETPRSSPGSADSYIGSLISLTSKSEIRYEGILFNINTQESSIGLRNVRSFGTEGRKMDGPQVAASSKIYEYILFRGTDIKDLQVKNQSPVQATTSLPYDPAIIQSHYPQAVTEAMSLPSGTGPISNPSVQTQQMGLPGQTFQSSVPLYQPRESASDPSLQPQQMGLPRQAFQSIVPFYQPGENLGSWTSSAAPPTATVSGVNMPTYWPGYYGSLNGFQAPQQSLLHPPPSLSMMSSIPQAMQYPMLNGSFSTGASSFPASQLPGLSAPLLPPFTSGILNLHPSFLPIQSTAVVSDSSSLISNNDSSHPYSTATLDSSLSLVPPLTSTISDKPSILSTDSDKPKIAPPSILPFSAPVSTVIGGSSSILNEGALPSLVTPGQLLPPKFPAVPTSSQPLPSIQANIEVVKTSSVEVFPLQGDSEAQKPLLPLPSSNQKLRGAHTYTYYNNRGGHGRGRGSGISRPMTRFTEEFDFNAMNEKFNKDEVWGDLGRSGKVQEDDGDVSLQDDNDSGSPKYEVGPGYVKDDFFDSLSCNAIDRGSQNGRPKFSEQRRRDTETFGFMPRHHGARGSRGYGRGGGGGPPRGRGYYGRGYGYGYVGRGDSGRGGGYNPSNPTS